MTVQYKSKVFKAGNSAAFRLPKDIAFALGTELTIERQGDVVTIKPARDEAEEARAFRIMLDEIDAIWTAAGGPPPREVRDPDIFPDRPGLY
jgi:antitoxin VapB